MSGLGGGVVMVPLLADRLNFPIKTASSISLGAIVLMATSSLLFIPQVYLPGKQVANRLVSASSCITHGFRGSARGPFRGAIESLHLTANHETDFLAIFYRGNFTDELFNFRMNSRFLILALLLGNQLFAQTATLTERLRYHVYYLADDSLEGRLTGTRGEEKAKAYISKSFAEIGLKPAGDAGGWYQAFTFTSKQELGKSELKLGKMRLRADDDYLVLLSSASGTVTGKLVPVGYGIRNVKLSHDDYPATKDVKGKIALVQLGSPDGNNPHGRFGADATIEAKVALAKSLGAIGVIFYRTDSTTMLPEMRLDRRTQSAGLPAVCIKAPVKAELPKVAAFSTEIIKTSTTGHNVAGYIDNGASYTVVIGAHYDHLGDGSLGGSLHAGKGAIHNGADDNASGTAGLIELARVLKERQDKRFNYLFLAFSGEELGLLGSAYFAKNATVPLDKVSCMLNMDMIGRLDTATLQLGVNGTGTSPFWKQVVDSLASPLKVKTTESGNGASDHTSFYLQNLPVLHFLRARIAITTSRRTMPIKLILMAKQKYSLICSGLWTHYQRLKNLRLPKPVMPIAVVLLDLRLH